MSKRPDRGRRRRWWRGPLITAATLMVLAGLGEVGVRLLATDPMKRKRPTPSPARDGM